jgi:hypothetical protein
VIYGDNHYYKDTGGHVYALRRGGRVLFETGADADYCQRLDATQSRCLARALRDAVSSVSSSKTFEAWYDMAGVTVFVPFGFRRVQVDATGDPSNQTSITISDALVLALWLERAADAIDGGVE